ncbi:MAG TPA: sensor protein KdpD, partial [Flavisolibacter sp.]|nr:sensor protein KdpD [Flavisolibacter sp.]
IRKTARLSSYYNSQWYVLYVQTAKEATDKIPLDKQRHLINNFKNAMELGAEIIQLKADDVANAIIQTIEEKAITTVCLGKPHLKLWQIILKTSVFNQLLKTLSKNDVDLVILS